jgi:hypothetical protein
MKGAEEKAEVARLRKLVREASIVIGVVAGRDHLYHVRITKDSARSMIAKMRSEGTFGDLDFDLRSHGRLFISAGAS